MSARGEERRQRRWLAPEVVQTSSMDCGPAALKCLLDGHGRPASYGRLREACQTDVDGTSIDALEAVAGQLGLQAEQAMLPADQLLLPGDDDALLVVVRHPDHGTHFVIVWRRVGAWAQVMDPAAGRRWERVSALRARLHRHETGVEAGDWRAWAGSDEFATALQRHHVAIGIDSACTQRALSEAAADPGWFGFGVLDAATRLVASLVASGGLRRGRDAARMLRALVRQTITRPDDIHALVPAAYWSVVPDAANVDPTRERLRLRGAVVLRVRGLASGAPDALDDTALPADLLRALREKTPHPMAVAWRLMRQDGVLAPLALMGAVVLATGAVLFEMLLLRGLFDLSSQLAAPGQRVAAVVALLLFLALLMALELPIVAETLRLGRHLETRLRVALLQRLPNLHDRYFQSRPISDMADRAHGIQIARAVPQLALQAVQTLLEMLLVVAAMLWLAPASTPWTLAMAAAALAVPLAVQSLIGERDLRVRVHAGALNGFYLDALLGLVPVSAHRAERNVQRQHEGLLVDWAAAQRSALQLSLGADALQALLSIALAAGLLWHHFTTAGSVGGGDLLLVFWTLKLPAIGGRLAGLAHQYPAQRNALMRLLEPLGAPTASAPDAGIGATPAPASGAPGLELRIDGGQVRAGGHEILRDVALTLRAGEHVAVVGASGAGKSSLLGVLLGWHTLAQGRLWVDGRDVTGTDPAALHAATAWVDPAVQLWNRSLLDNLLYAAPQDELGSVGAALNAAQLQTVAQKLPQGLQALLGEGGACLSGGEGQRVRLARALLAREARLVLLDEPFRGLDRAQRGALLTEARAWWREQTLLCVTHDLRETQAFDRVLVVDDGRIVEDGAPAELARSGTRYRALLDAEVGLQRTMWGHARWRRLELREGRLHDAASVAPRRAAAVAAGGASWSDAQ